MICPNCDGDTFVWVGPAIRPCQFCQGRGYFDTDDRKCLAEVIDETGVRFGDGFEADQMPFKPEYDEANLPENPYEEPPIIVDWRFEARLIASYNVDSPRAVATEIDCQNLHRIHGIDWAHTVLRFHGRWRGHR